MGIPNFISNPSADYYNSNNYLVVDLETTNINYGSALIPENRLVNASWWYDGKLFNKYDNEYNQQELLELIESVDFIVAQNSKFELQWFARMGIDIAKILPFDTMIAEKVLEGNRQVPLDLGSISYKRGHGSKDPYIDACIKAGMCPSTLPVSLIIDRCNKDVEQTHKVFLDQRQQLEQEDKLRTLFTRCIFTPVLADIESNGLCLDCAKVQAEYEEELKRFNQIKKDFTKLIGKRNPKSPVQMAEYIYGELGFTEKKTSSGVPIRNKPNKTFPEGMPLTDEATILSLNPSTPDQFKFLELKSAFSKSEAALSKNLLFFFGVCKEYEGTFYGQFNQTITSTHRLSSSGVPLHFQWEDKTRRVQFQNLPRKYKPLFKPRHEGWLYLEADGAQLEFRVAGQLGLDVRAIQDIIDGVDVHSFTSETLTNAGQPTDRQAAKEHTFKPLYGGEYGTDAEMSYYKAFREKYPQIAAMQTAWIESVKLSARKALRIPTGLEFFWTKEDYSARRNDMLPRARHQICNYPVQSFATADIIPIAVTKLWHELRVRELQSIIVNTVHDSSPAEVHPEEKEIVRDLCIDAYTHYVYKFLEKVHGIKFVTPLGIGLKWGQHWGEGDEEKLQINPPYRLDGVNYG